MRLKQSFAPDRPLALSRGLASGLIASLTAAVVVYAFTVAYRQFINPGWIDNVLEWKVAQMRAAGLAEEAIRSEITVFRQANSPIGLIATTLVGTTLLGGLFSMAVSLLLRRKFDRTRA